MTIKKKVKFFKYHTQFEYLRRKEEGMDGGRGWVTRSATGGRTDERDEENIHFWAGWLAGGGGLVVGDSG